MCVNAFSQTMTMKIWTSSATRALCLYKGRLGVTMMQRSECIVSDERISIVTVTLKLRI